VLLITGSGPQDRDESLLGHKAVFWFFPTISRAKGLRCCAPTDRGTGRSTGNFGTATTADFATDVEAGYLLEDAFRDRSAPYWDWSATAEGGIIGGPWWRRANPNVRIHRDDGGLRPFPGDEILTAQLAGRSKKPAARVTKKPRRMRLTGARLLRLIETEKDEAALEKN